MRTKIMSAILVSFVISVFGLAGCGGGGGGGGDSGGIAPNNKVTAANAGSAQNVRVLSLVTLDGSQSTGADGKVITYQWSFSSKPAGSNATLSNPTTVNPTFTPDVQGVYVLSLIVNDGTVNSAPSTITITASKANSAPVAHAGLVQNKTVGQLVTLDGSLSSDADNDLLKYEWTVGSKPAGSLSGLSSSSIVNPTFTPDVVGAYVLNLVVNDGIVDSAVSTVTINVSLLNIAPVANAGTNLKVRTGKILTLDGSASSDADGGALSYAWSFTSKPAGSNAVLSDTTAINPTFTPDVDGSYAIKLIVNDGKVDSDQSVVTMESVTDLRLLFNIITSRSATSINGYAQPGVSFSSNINNVTNETFILSKFELTNGGTYVASTTNASLLSDNLLAPGEYVPIKYTITVFPIQDLGFVANYYFTDSVTNSNFVVSASYQ